MQGKYAKQFFYQIFKSALRKCTLLVIVDLSFAFIGKFQVFLLTKNQETHLTIYQN